MSWATPRHGVPPLGNTAEPSFARVNTSTRFAVIAGGILLLAAVNLTYRLNRETITEWDESLYATSAWEMLQTGDWVSTRFLGEIDYYNTKPPLNVWLIALTFKTIGVSPASLRLPSVVSAWLTVALLMLWVRRRHGDLAGAVAGLVLTTCFAFIYVHAARSANTDAIFTLLTLLVVITLDCAVDRPSRFVWLGPILAMVFLLRGTAVLMPLSADSRRVVDVAAQPTGAVGSGRIGDRCIPRPDGAVGGCALARRSVAVLRQALELRPGRAQPSRARRSRRRRFLLSRRAAEVSVRLAVRAGDGDPAASAVNGHASVDGSLSGDRAIPIERSSAGGPSSRWRFPR